jgi:hypothetical protein
MNRWLGCAAGLLLAGVAPVFADGAAEPSPPLHVLQTHGPASLSTSAPVTDGRLSIAFTDELGLVVQVAGAASLQVKPPQPWVVEPWHVSRVEPPRVDQTGDGVRWSQRFWLEPLAPGETPLALAPLQYREKNGPWRSVAWKPVAVTVSARLKQPDVDTARDITSIEEVPGVPTGDSGSWIVAALAGTVLVVFVVWRWLRRPGGAAPRAPEAWALAELNRLAALRLADRGKSERLATLLVGLVRRYLEKKFNVPARRQTTAEFLETLPPRLAEQRPWLETLLTRCDQIKFAPIEAHAEECARLVEEVRRWLSSAG